MNESIIWPATAAIIAAAAKHGADLLATTTPEDADPALRTARNLIARLRIDPDHGADVLAATQDAVTGGGTDDQFEALGAIVAAAATGDPNLASDLEVVLSQSWG